MDIPSLKSKLLANHQLFTTHISNLTSEAFLLSRNNKWTAGQQLEHIYLSVKPVRQALSLPKFLLKFIFGKANRESRSYDDLVKKYLQKLESGGRAPGRFVPKSVHYAKRENLVMALDKEVNKLCSKLNRYTESELDTYIIPHPLLGKLTLREMIYFTIYHVTHHLEQTKQNTLENNI